MAEVDGELWAARVETGAAIADPFRLSGELVEPCASTPRASAASTAASAFVYRACWPARPRLAAVLAVCLGDTAEPDVRVARRS